MNQEENSLSSLKYKSELNQSKSLSKTLKAMIDSFTNYYFYDFPGDCLTEELNFLLNTTPCVVIGTILHKKGNILIHTVCFEDNCIIIHEKQNDFHKSFFSEHLSTIIHDFNNVFQVGDYKFNHNHQLIPNIELNEIINFYSKFIREIEENTFLIYTIKPIFYYLIKRFDYKTSQFKNPYFFNLFDSYNFQTFPDDEFLILNTFTGGSSSNVFLAIHLHTLYIVAIKVFKNNMDFQLNNYSSSREEKIGRDFQNIFILRCYGIFKLNQNAIVFEYMSKGSLDNFVLQQPNIPIDFSGQAQTLLLIRLVFGVLSLHLNGFVHRDLKPDNVLISHDGLSYLSDFGLSREVDDYPMTIDVGSHKYSSPEMKSNRKVDFMTDIYSLGQIIEFLIISNEHVNQSTSLNDYNNLRKISKLCSNDNCIERIDIFSLIDLITRKTNYFPDNNSNDSLTTELLKAIDCSDDKDINLYAPFEVIYTSDLNHSKIELKIIKIYSLIYDFQIQNNKSKTKKCFYERVKTIHYLTKLAKNNNSYANYHLGFMYLKCDLLSLNITKAMAYLKKAASFNNPRALFSLGIIYKEGKFYPKVLKNLKKSFEYFEKSAELNYSNAQIHLGISYENGYFVEPNLDKAVNYYKIAAKQNNSYGHIQLGHYYASRNRDKSKKYYEQSWEIGNPNAYTCLGHSYEYNSNFPLDVDKALYYYELAREKNDIRAFLVLGFHEQYVSDVKDLNKALSYYKQAAKFKDANAYYYLSTIYQDKSSGHYNLKKFIKNLKISAKLNCTLAQNTLAGLYEDGLHEDGLCVKQNIKKAFKYYSKAAEQDVSYSQQKLGILFYFGDKIQQNIEKSIHYYNQIVSDFKKNNINRISRNDDSGYYYACYNLGLIYCSEDKFYDIDQAKYFFLEGSGVNLPICNNCLGVISLFYENDYKKALSFLHKTIFQNYALLYTNLGIVEEKENNILMAMEHYEKASQHFDDDHFLFHNNQNIYNTHMKMALQITSLFSYLKFLCLTLEHTENFSGHQHEFWLEESIVKLKRYTFSDVLSLVYQEEKLNLIFYLNKLLDEITKIKELCVIKIHSSENYLESKKDLKMNDSKIKLNSVGFNEKLHVFKLAVFTMCDELSKVIYRKPYYYLLGQIPYFKNAYNAIEMHVDEKNIDNIPEINNEFFEGFDI
ncbi:hypothetical protein TRFO_25833 [Tritrichomonas foetus]|uniref:Protein kinase domain-containing protein n=1 Tax=Tritrichomonas foetus TaxID=1144522 RepID=A0A1J4K5Q4_9EUKA|nr:hypothetical protein TRFO_25833 [Tritrichomonas foetus]|eukprot:OHT06208.1 hypothetical protein TRFO_25833 [Tritrichomonas foetus]